MNTLPPNYDVYGSKPINRATDPGGLAIRKLRKSLEIPRARNLAVGPCCCNKKLGDTYRLAEFRLLT